MIIFYRTMSSSGIARESAKPKIKDSAKHCPMSIDYIALYAYIQIIFL